MAEKKNVRIRLFKDNSRYKGDLFVSVNGVNYKIRRGVEVEVPPEVAEVLEHSQMQDELTAARIAAAGENTARLLVYDTERALWSEENVCSYEMTSTGGQLYLWDGQALWAADPSREADWQATDGVEEKLNFELTTGDIGLDGAEDRYLSRLTLRLDAECSSTVEVAASYDGGPWETVASLTAQDKRRSFDLPFVPRRHGTLRLRLKGRGQITLRSIAKTMAAAKGGIAGGEV